MASGGSNKFQLEWFNVTYRTVFSVIGVILLRESLLA